MPKHKKSEASKIKKIPDVDFSRVGKSKRLAKKNEEYLDLLSVVTKSQYLLAAEQEKLKSKPAKNAAGQVLRQLELISGMVQLPHLILMTMEGSIYGAHCAIEDFFSGKRRNLEDDRKVFEQHLKTTMQKFFALDVTGSLSRTWLFAVSVYSWTAFECLAGDLWTSSLNQATTLGHHVLCSLPGSNAEDGALSRRHIDVGLAARYGFDLRRSLGTILKKKFDFSSFEGVRAAYKQAFGSDGELGDVEGLKQLEQVRHLIVHRGGIADDKFVKLTKINARPGAMLTLAVPIVVGYIVSATLGCAALLKIVDEWFAASQEGTNCAVG